MKQPKGETSLRWIGLLANLIFFLAFPLADGPVWCKDSLSYTSMDCSREPLYPLFLKLFRDLLGDGNMPYDQPLYLFAAVLVQSAIAGIVVWLITQLFVSFGFNGKQKALLGFGANAAFWGVQLLCRFAALRGSAYPESIMTEGLGMSLWLLFVIAAFHYFHTGKKRYLVLTAIWMVLCISLRKQLLVCLLTFVGFAFIYELCIRKKWKSFLTIVCACVISFGASTLIDYSYNYAYRGIWMQHTGNAMGIDCTLLYTTTSEDAALFDQYVDENGADINGINAADLKALFLAIQSQMEEQNLRYVDVPADASWVELTSHYADAYDVIGYEIMNPVMDSYVEAEYPDIEKGSPQYYLQVDQIEVGLRNVLFHQNLKRYMTLAGFNFIKGLVNTVLRMNQVLIAASAVLYLLYMILLIRLLQRDYGMILSGHVCVFSWLVLAGIAVNCAAVGAVIFPQTRYMIYNMGLFYAVLWAMLVKLAVND